ncbi:transmembrane amino acid transporter protein-domain-containing protein [Camillea tinctor]|nr:transmembrane amino acid transporter protein-domain-containing protein [Camillea tinctor]
MVFTQEPVPLDVDVSPTNTSEKGSSPELSHQSPNNPKISLKDYLHHASITRANEMAMEQERQRLKQNRPPQSFIKGWFSRDSTRRFPTPPDIQRAPLLLPTSCFDDLTPRPAHETTATENPDLNTARISSWINITYLIITEILGPSGAPWSFAQLGYGPGVALYTLFGALAAYSGWLLWQMYLHLDSAAYPVRNYADVFARLLGARMEICVNVAQTLFLVCVMGLTILMNGQAIAQMSRGPGGGGEGGICFVACLVMFVVAGFAVSQVRTLRRMGWLAHCAAWLNVVIVVAVMVLVTRYSPNFQTVMASFGPQWGEAPIVTFSGMPPSNMTTGGIGRFIASINGVNQAVTSFGGTSLFVFFLAEMRHPWDFWKSLLCAEAFMYIIYVVYGTFVYHYHGQFTYTPITQGISNYGWQTALNVINIVISLIGCGIYGNIGLKIAYNEIFVKVLHFPSLSSSRGKIWWAILAPLYWILAFTLAAAIPQFAFISALVGALFIGGLSYTLPALAAVSFWIQRDAVEIGEAPSPSQISIGHTNFKSRKYYHAFMKRPLFNLFNVVYFLGGLVICTLGCYAAITQLVGAFRSNITTSFTCKSPV